MADASSKRAIERAVTAALARKGMGGTVVVHDGTAELHGVGDTVVAIDLGDWVEQWSLLPQEICDARAEAAATRLAKAAGSVEPVASKPIALGRWLTAMAAIALVGGIGWVLHRSGFFGRAPAAETPSASAAPEEDAGVRTRRACEAARRRLYAGAAMGIDTAGWVVELWLAGEGLGDDPALQAAGEAARTALDNDGAVAVSVGDGNATLTFSGMAHAFFERDGRERFIALADDLAARTDATRGALYARCEHLDVHDVGAWYHGRDDAAAVVALWSTAGVHAEGKGLDPAAVAAADATTVTDDLAAALRAVGARRVESPSGVSIRLPFAGPTRAAELSRRLAAAAGL